MTVVHTCAAYLLQRFMVIYVAIYMVIYGHMWPYIWPYMAIYGPYMAHKWPYMGHIWPYMVHICPYMVIYGPYMGHIWPYRGGVDKYVSYWSALNEHHPFWPHRLRISMGRGCGTGALGGQQRAKEAEYGASRPKNRKRSTFYTGGLTFVKGSG